MERVPTTPVLNWIGSLDRCEKTAVMSTKRRCISALKRSLGTWSDRTKNKQLRERYGDELSEAVYLLLRNKAGHNNREAFELYYDLLKSIAYGFHCSEDYLASARMLSEQMQPESTLVQLFSHMRR